MHVCGYIRATDMLYLLFCFVLLLLLFVCVMFFLLCKINSTYKPTGFLGLEITKYNARSLARLLRIDRADVRLVRRRLCICLATASLSSC